MFCDNCGTSTEDGAIFCPKCGQRLLGKETHMQGVPPRKSATFTRMTQRSDNLCFGDEEKENTYGTGIFFIFLALFLAIIFFVPGFPVEVLVVLGFFVLGIYIIIQTARKNK